MTQDLHPVISLRLFTDRKCFGPGVAALLHGVEGRRSLRAAAQAMGMAYSKAWRILHEAEEQLGFKLLDSTAGGRHGGGAVLTPEGARFLAAYDGWAAAVRAEAERLFAEQLGPWAGPELHPTGMQSDKTEE